MSEREAIEARDAAIFDVGPVTVRHAEHDRHVLLRWLVEAEQREQALAEALGTLVRWHQSGNGGIEGGMEALGGAIGALRASREARERGGTDG